MRDVNANLCCVLCSGYLVDATTIIECLHTFCRSCILRYLESSDTCPVCDASVHPADPTMGIKADKTLQALVYKIVPGLYQSKSR
uniref:RING-type domain-containing protein n=1 Tax=Helobdella robusta TaxID=6412 RepID=T1EJS0_HELRO